MADKRETVDEFFGRITARGWGNRDNWGDTLVRKFRDACIDAASGRDARGLREKLTTLVAKLAHPNFKSLTFGEIKDHDSSTTQEAGTRSMLHTLDRPGGRIDRNEPWRRWVVPALWKLFEFAQSSPEEFGRTLDAAESAVLAVEETPTAEAWREAEGR